MQYFIQSVPAAAVKHLFCACRLYISHCQWGTAIHIHRPQPMAINISCKKKARWEERGVDYDVAVRIAARCYKYLMQRERESAIGTLISSSTRESGAGYVNDDHNPFSAINTWAQHGCVRFLSTSKMCLALSPQEQPSDDRTWLSLRTWR